MATQSKEIKMGVDELLTVLEPLIRRIVREELTRVVEESPHVFYLEPDMPLYEDLEDILQRKAQDKVNLLTHDKTVVFAS
jgi:hypothetical protein